MKGNRRRRAERGLVVIALIAGLLVFGLTGEARAAGTALSLGSATGSEPPSVAVDNSGNALIAWSTKDTVKYCVLPAEASSCSQSGTLTPAGGEDEIGAVTALVNGGTDVILANTFGNAFNRDYDPLQMWSSADGGTTFTAQAGGLSVGSGVINNDTVPVNGVILPGGGSLGFGWETAISAPSFNAFSATAPTECSGLSCPQGFATLEPTTNADQVGNLAAHFASNDDGVLGIFQTNATSGPFGCSAGKTVPFGVAYVFGDGLQSPSNDYNVSPGLANTAWRVPVTQADCNVEYSTVGGGPSGFGILEQDDLANDTIYHHYSGITDSFSPKPVVVSSQGEQQPALSQDSAGGVYATFLSVDAQGPISLAYSANGGSTWAGPATLSPGGTVHNLTSDVNASGQGFVVWLDGQSIHAQSFTAADSVAPATAAPTATSTANTVSVGVTCSELPCTVLATLSAPASQTKAARAAVKKKTKTVTLGSGKLTTRKKGAQQLTIKLNGAGRKLRAAHHGDLKLTLGIVEKAARATVTSSRTVTVKAPKATHHSKH